MKCLETSKENLYNDTPLAPGAIQLISLATISKAQSYKDSEVNIIVMIKKCKSSVM